jgi:O-antigen/teichoic acid export membrane protein
MKRIGDWFRRTAHRLSTDILYRNSIYLMISSVVLTGFGFFFWTINAKLFSPHDVGIATTVISAMNLIASLASLGLGIALVRFLPSSKDKSGQINSGMAVTTLAAIIIATAFVTGLSIFSPKLLFIKQNLYYGIVFIMIVAFQAQSNYFDRVFVALRDTKYALLKNSVFSVFKLIFPFLLIGFGAFGIFGSWGLALLISSLYSIWVLAQRFRIHPEPVIYDSILRKIFSFSFWNYVSNIINMLPGLVLPLIITQYLSPEQTAYYYVAMMIASLVFIIPIAVSSSMFAEGSNAIHQMRRLTIKSTWLIAVLIVPALLVLIFAAPFLLGLFGEDYSSSGTTLLIILALSAIPQAVKSVYLSILNVRQRMGELIAANAIVSISVIGLSIWMIPGGLNSLGIAWMLGQCTIFPVLIIGSALRRKSH